MKFDFLTLNNGNVIPQLGLGVFDVSKSICESVVSNAIDIGYRHFDTAAIYGNEKEVGAAVTKSNVARKEFFITTKFWGHRFDYKQTQEDFKQSLGLLQTDYIDLYLIHFPEPNYLESWLALEDLYHNGLIKSIGVSNFNIRQIENILENGTVIPSVNQIRVDPLNYPKALINFQKSVGILTQAWGPLAQNSYDIGLIPGVSDIAKKYDKTPHQVVLRWHIQKGHIVFPKTVRVEKMLENISIFDFELTDEEINKIMV